jgi:hypothetical protein
VYAKRSCLGCFAVLALEMAEHSEKAMEEYAWKGKQPNIEKRYS